MNLFTDALYPRQKFWAALMEKEIPVNLRIPEKNWTFFICLVTVRGAKMNFVFGVTSCILKETTLLPVSFSDINVEMPIS
jgi:hypothetical protein